MYYNNDLDQIDKGYKLDLRFQLAFEMLSKHALVCAFTSGEDSAGRSKLKLQDVKQTISRTFDLMDAFIKEAENREWLTPIKMTTEERLDRVGEIEKLRYQNSKKKYNLD